ncbi:MAG: hypothetical protein LC662_08075 [Rhodothermaceae bacterium]|nr:hypothetical protein [Rhodothermaceae bacterium]
MDVAIIEFALLFVALGLSKLLVMTIQHYKHKSEVDELVGQFNIFWNGREEDELYAWYRVRLHLMNSQSSQRRKNYVDQRISHLNKSKIVSKTMVTPRGELLMRPAQKDTSY